LIATALAASRGPTPKINALRADLPPQKLVTRTEKGKNGEPVMVLMPRVTIVDADKISDEAAAAVAEVSQTVNGALRVKLHDKQAVIAIENVRLFDEVQARTRELVRTLKRAGSSPQPPPQKERNNRADADFEASDRACAAGISE
jgi:hypothetical protein